MADESGLPADVVALLHQSLPSMVHIELLLLLARSVPRAWSRLDAAVELRSSPQLVDAAFGDLHAARLAAPGAEPGVFTFAVTDTATLATVVALQDMYDRLPVTLIRALYQRPAAPVAPVAAADPARAFADAFRIRPKDRP